MDYLAIVGIVFVINVVPAFAPPTWAVLVLLRLETGVPSWSIVVLGAVSAALGRLTLAVMTRRLRGHLSNERVANLDAGRALLTSGRTRGVALVALFAVSPLPSAQLFEAAGLLNVPLVRFTAAFFAGRIVSYSFYVAIASVATRSFGTLIRDTLLSPFGLLLQLAMIGLVVAVVRIDWIRLSQRIRHRRGEPRTGRPKDN